MIYRIIFVLIAFSFIHTTFSQEYMDTIVNKSCVCIEEISDTITQEALTFELGICMIQAALPYGKQLKNDYDINIDYIDTEGEKLGALIASKMAGVCPDRLVYLVQKIDEDEDNSTSEQILVGNVSNIDSALFIIFHITDLNGKTSKCYWLTFIRSEIDLINNYKSLLNKKVEITYLEQDFFDPRILEYRNHKIITDIQVIE